MGGMGKIYIDISTAVHSRAGLGRYTENLTTALLAAQPERFRLFHNTGREGRVPDSLRHVPRTAINAGFKPWRMAVYLAHRFRYGFDSLVPGVDLFHSTEHLLMPLRGAPTILTVHDLIFKLFPEYHKKLNYWFLNAAMPLFCQRATAIVTVSEASKADIVSHYQINPAKIHVIHEAAATGFARPERPFIQAVRAKYGLHQPYLLHLGTIEPRKNISRLIDVTLQLRQTHPELQLVLVGSKGWLVDDLFERLNRENLHQVVLPLGWVDDAELPAIIAGAELAVQPSLYEGFGLPLLEHMACGQVVAASNRSSLPEIGGEAAAYFDPEDTQDMAAVIERLLGDPQEYAQRQAAGYGQATKFSWERAAQETIALYDHILAKTPVPAV